MLFIIWLWLGVIQVESNSQLSIAIEYTKIFGFFFIKRQKEKRKKETCILSEAQFWDNLCVARLIYFTCSVNNKKHTFLSMAFFIFKSYVVPMWLIIHVASGSFVWKCVDMSQTRKNKAITVHIYEMHSCINPLNYSTVRWAYKIISLKYSLMHSSYGLCTFLIVHPEYAVAPPPFLFFALISNYISLCHWTSTKPSCWHLHTCITWNYKC